MTAAVPRVRVGTFSPSVVLRLARRLGLLAEAGLDVLERPVASSPAQFTSLRDGELDLAITSPDNVLGYRFSPANPLGAVLDAHVVEPIDRGLGLALYARPGLAAADALRGQRVGVDVPNSGFALALYAIAESLGVGRDEYELVSLGSTPRRLTALLDGACDATMLNAGNELRAEEAGCLRVAGAADVCAPYLGTVLAVLGEEHLPAAQALVGALRGAREAVHSDQGARAAAREAAEALRLSPELAERYVDRLRDPDQGLVLDGSDDRAGLATAVALRQRHLPEIIDGRDVLESALDPASGLMLPAAPPAAGP
ncbi:ABC transporter substrate-binding protein [Nocardioides pyridinolyticus]